MGLSECAETAEPGELAAAARKGRCEMNLDVAVAVAGLLIAVAAVVLGAWLDLRPHSRDDPRHRLH
jgi:hypothetical protein